MKIKFKRIVLLILVFTTILSLSGCTSMQMTYKELESKLYGLSVTIRTFDEESNVIDKIRGTSVSVMRDSIFDTKDGEGNSQKDSSVIQISIGNNMINHVGSSLIMAEDGLEDIFEEYAKTVDVKNFDRATPFINTMINDFKNITTGKSKLILIRSQNGTPLATYIGNSVSIFGSDVPKTTVLLVDGHVLLIYRCDYTIYDIGLLEN